MICSGGFPYSFTSWHLAGGGGDLYGKEALATNQVQPCPLN